MSKRMSITWEDLDAIKAEVLNIVNGLRRKLPDFLYGDVRLETTEGAYAWAENGEPKASGRDFGLSLGVRAIAGNGIAASGHVGMVLGPADVRHLASIIKDALTHAHTRARANAEKKALAKKRFGKVARSLGLR